MSVGHCKYVPTWQRSLPVSHVPNLTPFQGATTASHLFLFKLRAAKIGSILLSSDEFHLQS